MNVVILLRWPPALIDRLKIPYSFSRTKGIRFRHSFSESKQLGRHVSEILGRDRSHSGFHRT